MITEQEIKQAVQDVLKDEKAASFEAYIESCPKIEGKGCPDFTSLFEKTLAKLGEPVDFIESSAGPESESYYHLRVRLADDDGFATGTLSLIKDWSSIDSIVRDLCVLLTVRSKCSWK